MKSGALARLSHVWALDSTYTSPVRDWTAWLRSRADLHITVIYRFAKYFSKKTQKEERLSTGVHGERFRAQVARSNGRLTVIPVPAGKLGHCAVPGKYLPQLLSSLDAAPSLEAFGAFADLEDDRDADGVSYEITDEAQQDGVLKSSGLTLAEIKAVQITSTFETGKRGGFYGLSGNFDGYGISFGLVNWNIGTGSLQPLLRDFAATEPARWKAIFGSDATKFSAVMTPKGKNAIRDQLRFAIEVMNSSHTVKGQTRWSVKEPWVTRFRQLAEDKAFQRIQVRYVRALLDRARQFCEQFSLKSEMSYAFMFDAVSSHGPWWLTKKWKDGTQRRRQLLLPRLAALDTKYGKGSVPERDVLLAIADVLAETSSSRWRASVSRRKRWFITGEHPRSAELWGLTPRANVSYQTSTKAAIKSTPAAEAEIARPSRTVAPGPMSDTERSRLIAAAYTQATTAGTPADRADIAETLQANGTNTKAWFDQMVPDATFLGQRIRESGGNVPGVHLALFQALQRAEHTLMKVHPGRTPAQLGKDMGIYSIAGLRPPKKATGAPLASYHCFGLAIDINHPTNPFVGNNQPKKPKKLATPTSKQRYAEFSANRSPCIVERAMWFLHGERFNPEKELTAKGAGAAWDIHHRASQALAEYLRLADDVENSRVQQLVAAAQARGDSRNLGAWKRRIVTDRAVIKNWDFQHHKHPEKTGYMDLPRELVVALADAGLLWGGLYRTAKDIMHFDLRYGPIQRRHK